MYRPGHHFRAFLPLALILCALTVLTTAILARSSLKLQGALTSAEPTPLTVITLLQEKFGDVSISDVESLPQRESEMVFDFTADIEDVPYLVRIDRAGPPWKLKSVERLHGEPAI